MDRGQAEGWERLSIGSMVYTLAWLLDDEDMMERATYYINCIIDGQAEDGWIRPDDTGDRSRGDLGQAPCPKGSGGLLRATEDKRIEMLLEALKALDRHIDTAPFWGHSRWFEGHLIWWLYERTERLHSDSTKPRCQGFDCRHSLRTGL